MILRRLFETDSDVGRLIARVALGIVIFPHGAQKLLGWFGGKGVAGTMEMFTGWGFPAFLVALLILTESVGALSLIAGLLGRIWAAGIAIIMLVAIFKVHLRFGFFMNWYAEPRGEGIEFHLLALGLAFITMAGGSGRWSIDGWIARRIEANEREAAS